MKVKGDANVLEILGTLLCILLGVAPRFGPNFAGIFGPTKMTGNDNEEATSFANFPGGKLGIDDFFVAIAVGLLCSAAKGLDNYVANILMLYANCAWFFSTYHDRMNF